MPSPALTTPPARRAATTAPEAPMAAQIRPPHVPGSARTATYVPSMTPELFVPQPERPVRAKLRMLAAATQVLPHSHPWAQVAISTQGVIRLTVSHGTFIVPPSRALWIPPGVEHAVTMVEDADLRTLYFYQPPGHCGPASLQGSLNTEAHPAHTAPTSAPPAPVRDPHAPGDDLPAPAHDPWALWRQCRVLEVSDLLRALVREMPTRPDGPTPPSAAELLRERHLSALVCDELARAAAVRLGVDLPHDKRLRHLCEAVIADPTRHATLDGWAQDSGASARTVARLFRSELGSSFSQWRQQVILAKAVALAAQRRPINQIAHELGYDSPSAFSAMVRRTMGMTPARFLGLQTH